MCDVLDWIQISYDMAQWRTVVKGGNFSTILMTNICSVTSVFRRVSLLGNLSS